MSATPNLGLPYIEAGQAQKHVTHNEALRSLDTLVQLAVEDRDLAEPPASPAEGARWIVESGASGAWSGHAGHIAAWQDGAWQFSVPVIGWIAYVVDEEILAAWDGGSWNAVSAGEGGGGGGDLSELQEVSLLGIGTTADTTNPLSAYLNNVLWAAKTVADGGDGTLRYKMSKESAAKTLSLLFQDNYVGCAEIGLTGDDDFHFKVSPDGTSWLEALKIDRASGKVSFPSGGAREMLTADRTYYVRSDGSNSNTGLTDSSGGAFLTIQKAYDVIAATLDLGGRNVTIKCSKSGDTFTAGLNISQPTTGGGSVTLRGYDSTPTNTVISTTSASCIAIVCAQKLTVRDMKLQTTTAGSCISAQGPGAFVDYGNINFGASAEFHVWMNGGAAIPGSNYTISGGAGAHVRGDGGSAVLAQGGITVTLTGTPSFSNGFFEGHGGASYSIYSWTFSGAATGKRYALDTCASINSFGAGSSTTFFPGNAAGTVSSGAQQV